MYYIYIYSHLHIYHSTYHDIAGFPWISWIRLVEMVGECSFFLGGPWVWTMFTDTSVSGLTIFDLHHPPSPGRVGATRPATPWRTCWTRFIWPAKIWMSWVIWWRPHGPVSLLDPTLEGPSHGNLQGRRQISPAGWVECCHTCWSWVTCLKFHELLYSCYRML